MKSDRHKQSKVTHFLQQVFDADEKELAKRSLTEKHLGRMEGALEHKIKMVYL
jgi:hypothetical protein